MLVAAEGIQVGEYGVALHLARVADLQMVRVGEHTPDLCIDLFGAVGQVYAVAEGLAHLGLAIRSRQSQAGSVLRKHNLRLDEHLAVETVELAYYLPGLLDHRLLVLARRYRGGFEGGDVSGLADRVAEESDRGAGLVGIVFPILAEAPHLDLRLYGRVPLESLYRHEVLVEEIQLGELADLRLYEYGGFLRVKSRREVVQRHLDYVLTDLLRVVRIVGKGLGIGYHYEYLLESAAVLKLNSPAE